MGHFFTSEMKHMTLRIGFLRHGQTDWNLEFRLQGISDIPLNETGRTQALSASEQLADRNWQVVTSSPLSRAVETATIISEQLGLGEVVQYSQLLERSFGEAEGLTYQEWRDRYQSGALAKEAESLEDLHQRAQVCLDHFAKTYSNQNILAVSHGAFIRKIVNIVSDQKLPKDGDRFSNLSMTILSFDGESWSIESYEPGSLAR